MQLALYDDRHGFYATTGKAGRRGDFITAPSVGPLFGAVVARAIDSWWRAAGEPDPFVFVDAGAGTGALAAAVLHAAPVCAPALRYVLVEVSAVQRAQHASRLVLESPTFAFAPDRADDEDAGVVRRDVVGPIVVSLPTIPRVQGPCVIFANELLDNLPFDVLERRGGVWHEVRVGVDDNGVLGERLVPSASPPMVDAPEGARVPVQTAAAEWVRDAIGVADRVVAVDYVSTTAELARRDGWLRTYRDHGRGDAPLRDLGAQDITADVCVDQLPAPSSDRAQADWLRAHGLDELVAEGLGRWEAERTAPTVATLEARARAADAVALTDPEGIGGFRVLEWTR